MSSVLPNVLKPILLPIRLDSLGLFFVSFLIPIVAHQTFSANGWQMGLLFSLQAVGTGISALLFSKKVNSWLLRAPLSAFACLLKSIAYCCLYMAILVNNFELMIVATFALGFASGLFWLIWQSSFAQLSEYKDRAQVLGFASKQVGLGIMIGSCLAFSIISIAEIHGLSNEVAYCALPLFSFASLYASKISFTAYTAITAQLTDNKGTVQTTYSSTTYTFIALFLFIMIFVGQLSGSLVAPFLEIYLLDHLQVSSIADLSIAYIPGGIVSMLFAPRLGAIADKVNAALYLGCAGVVGAFTTWLMLQSTELWQISILFVVDASVITSSGLVLAKLVSEVAGENKSSAFGVQGFISNLGAIAGPLVGGAFWQIQGSQGPFLFSISTELLLAACCFIILLPVLKSSGKVKNKQQYQ